MSLIWGEALRKVYPEQEPRYRPSGIGKCGLQQAGMVSGVKSQNQDWTAIWQWELGRAGQDIILNAFPGLGFRTIGVSNLVEDGPLPGEDDYECEALPGNILDIPAGTLILADVKVRAMYAYVYIWGSKGDLMAENPDIGMQMVMYMGQRGYKKGMIILAPFDSSAVRNEIRFKKNAPLVDTHLRVFSFDFNPELYLLGLERLAILQEFGVKVAPEFNPYAGKFPCTYCGIIDWCKGHGQEGVMLPEVPGYGLPMLEHEIP